MTKKMTNSLFEKIDEKGDRPLFYHCEERSDVAIS
jgi:hypothetical protein